MDYRIPVAIRWIFCRNLLYTLWYWIIEVKKKIGTVLLMYRTLDRRFDVITS